MDRWGLFGPLLVAVAESAVPRIVCAARIDVRSGQRQVSGGRRPGMGETRGITWFGACGGGQLGSGLERGSDGNDGGGLASVGFS
jgi:hypothetical protein